MGLTLAPCDRRSWLDAGLTLGAVVVDLALFTTLSDATDQVGWAGSPSLWLVLGMGLLGVPLLWWRRRRPVPACLAVAAHAATVTVLLGSRPLVGPLVAVYAASSRSRRGPALVALGAVLAAHAVAVGYEASFAGSGPSTGAVAAVAVVYVLLDLGTWLVGRFGAGAAARARTRQLVHERADEGRRAVEEERRRIARELHDIVAHSVTVMVLQSAGAKRMVGSQPERAVEAMDAVEQQGRQAVAELRRLLGVIRAADDETIVPPPRAGTVDELVRAAVNRWAGTGLTVEVIGTGAEVAIDPSVAATVERVVAEGLVNVARHGGSGADAQVRLVWGRERILVEVLNELSGAPSEAAGLSTGSGLAGLAERVRLVGGTLTAGVTPGGFRLAAELPTSSVGRDEPLVTA